LITLEYFAQARQAAGCDHDQFDMETSLTLQELIQRSCERHGEGLSEILLDQQKLAAWILVSINGTAATNHEQILHDGDVIRLLSPISGG
jgi:MoaD family protein